MKSFSTVKKQPCSAWSTGSLGCLPSTRRESKNAQAHLGISGSWLEKNLRVSKSQNNCLPLTELSKRGETHSSL